MVGRGTFSLNFNEGLLGRFQVPVEGTRGTKIEAGKFKYHAL